MSSRERHANILLIKPNASYDHHGHHRADNRMAGSMEAISRTAAPPFGGAVRRGAGHGVARTRRPPRREGYCWGPSTRGVAERMLWRLEAEEAPAMARGSCRAAPRAAVPTPRVEEMLWRQERGEERMARPGGDRWVLWWLR